MAQFLVLLCYCAMIAVTWTAEADLHPDDGDDLKNQLGTLRNTMKVLSDQWEKWNTLFITSLEPRITSTASTLSSIDSNIHNLQERAHIWDTFQLHVAAWNDQLATMDRKMDILNKAVEQISGIDTKINTILSDEYKLDKLTKMTNSLLETALGIDNSLKSRQHCKSKDTSLFEEFAARGILSSLKLMERKVDQLMSTRQGQGDCKQAGGSANSPKNTEVLLNDIASKVDIIFDSVSKSNEIEYADEYIDARDSEGSGASPNRIGRHLVIKSVDQRLKEVAEKVTSANGNLINLLRQGKNQLGQDGMVELMNQFAKSVSINQTRNLNLVLESYFHDGGPYWGKMSEMLKGKCWSPASANVDKIFSNPRTKYMQEIPDLPSEVPLVTTSCNDVTTPGSSNGIYGIVKSSQGDFIKERFFNKQFCQKSDHHHWTVIQRRDNYTIQQNFNVSWTDYKVGFGDLRKDFWMGNTFLARLSASGNLTLRVELEDFEGNTAWAEYEEFAVAGEDQQFKLTIGGYSGNASDALSSHSGAGFSTYDRKNDLAPECCPCSVSYGGGWWFNRCFESNLNGVYFKNPLGHDYFRGVIWEHWRGNYSLKRSVMMVRTKGDSRSAQGNEVEEP